MARKIDSKTGEPVNEDKRGEQRILSVHGTTNASSKNQNVTYSQGIGTSAQPAG